MRRNYDDEKMSCVKVMGIPCEFTDIRLERSTIPEGKLLYEVADDDSDGEPARIKTGILVNFYGTLVADQKLPLGEDGVLWLEPGDFVFD